MYILKQSSYKITTTSVEGVAPHTHTTACEVIQCFEDSGKILINGKVYKMQKNGLYFIDGLMPHFVLPDDMTKYLHSILIFNVPELEKLCQNLSMMEEYKAIFTKNGGTFCALSEEDVIKTDSIIQQINKAYHHEDKLRYPKIASGVIALFDMALKNVTNADDTDSKISEILSYINENAMHKFTMEDLSQAVNISKYHMCRLFKEQMGTTIGTFILSKRLSLAKHMLLETNYSITQIANKVSFSSSSAFSALFTKEIGCTPTAFRIKYK